MSESNVLNSDSNNEPGQAHDPFDLENLKLSQDFAGSIGVKKVLTTVPCCKPNRHEFVRVRPGEEWRLETGLFEDKIQRERYLVDRDLGNGLGSEISPVCLFLSITRQGNLFLWPVKMPDSEERSDPWNNSAMAAAKLATEKWIRLASNMHAGYYDIYEAEGKLADPEWPNMSFQEILKICFKDRFIGDANHPILRALRGEI